MTTLFNNSFDSSPNSDSDDDFMVDSIISSDRKPCNSEPVNIKSECMSWMKKDDKFSKNFNLTQKNNNKFTLKRTLSNNTNVNIDRDGQFTKFMKLTADKSMNFHQYPRIKYFDNDIIRRKIDSSKIYNECNSNAPSSFTESDKTHSAESSPGCILHNDPIITSVVLNEKRFNSSSDTASRLPFDDNINDIPMSFDKSFYSTSIDDNLLRPMRYNQFISGSSHQMPSGSSSVRRNNSLSLKAFKLESTKRSRSMGLDKQTLSQDRRVRSSESLAVSKYTSVSVVSEASSDCMHSSSTTTAIVSTYPRKLQSANSGNNKRKHLLQFIIDLLKEGHACVNWSNKKEKEFFIAQPEKLALLWATYKNNNKMTFDSLARSLRLYYAPKKLERISGKKNHYRILNLSHEISFTL